MINRCKEQIVVIFKAKFYLNICFSCFGVFYFSKIK